MTNWLGVVCADHVRRGVSLGIAQIGHGKRNALARMHPGDTLVYYSPRMHLDDPHSVLRAFTAIGTIPDDELWQADEGSFRPWRRKVTYLQPATEIPLAALHASLDLTATTNWGYRGLIEITDHDIRLIRAAMTESP